MKNEESLNKILRLSNKITLFLNFISYNYFNLIKKNNLIGIKYLYEYLIENKSIENLGLPKNNLKNFD